MKHVLLLLFIFPLFAFSQCPPDGTFTSQAEIDAFAIEYPDCTELINIAYLIIEGDDITDLSGLAQIENAAGLQVVNNPVLQTLNGLNPSLETYFIATTSFAISNNSSLFDISALSNAMISGQDLIATISDNPMLTSLNGLQGVHARIFNVTNNNSLTDIGGIGEFIMDLDISGNDNLIDLSGLQNYDGQYLTISGNSSLESFNIQSGISVEFLTITGNPNLTNIELAENSSIWASLTIENNTSLSVCNSDFVCDFMGANLIRFINISNNLPGCNNIVEIEYACGRAPNSDDCEFDVEGYLEDYFTVDIGETIIVNNEFATTSTPVPSCNEITDRRDLWFVFNSGSLTSVDVITEVGYSVQLWEGSCYNLMQVENACGGPALNDVTVVPDTYYIVQIWSDGSGRMTSASGWFDLTVQDGLLSTTENDLSELSKYPNPTNDILNIKATNKIDSISIYNLLGQQVVEMFPNTTEIQINMETLKSGIYLMEATIQGQKKAYKVVKE